MAGEGVGQPESSGVCMFWGTRQLSGPEAGLGAMGRVGPPPWGHRRVGTEERAGNTLRGRGELGDTTEGTGKCRVWGPTRRHRDHQA